MSALTYATCSVNLANSAKNNEFFTERWYPEYSGENDLLKAKA